MRLHSFNLARLPLDHSRWYDFLATVVAHRVLRLASPSDIAADADFLDAPSDQELTRLYDLWRSKRGLRLMPSRSDFDPAEFRSLLPNMFVIDLDGRFNVRLAGEVIVEFFGCSSKSDPDGTFEGRDAMVRLMKLLIERRAPIFRAGPAYWSREKRHRRFEACFLPLSADDKSVNMVLAAAKFS